VPVHFYRLMCIPGYSFNLCFADTHPLHRSSSCEPICAYKKKSAIRCRWGKLIKSKNGNKQTCHKLWRMVRAYFIQQSDVHDDHFFPFFSGAETCQYGYSQAIFLKVLKTNIEMIIRSHPFWRYKRDTELCSTAFNPAPGTNSHHTALFRDTKSSFNW